LADIAEIGFAANTDALSRAVAALEKLAGAAHTAEPAVDQLNDEMDRMPITANKAGGAVHKLAGVIGGSFRAGLLGAAAAMAAAFGAQAILGKLGATAESLDAVSKAARAVGSSVPEMQALATAGELAGLSADEVAKAATRMNRVLGAAMASGKGTSGVFKQLGISAKELAELPVDQRFAKIADRLQELGASSADTTAILAALGDRGGNLVSLLGEGGDQIRAAAEDVDRFNLAISGTQGLAIEEMNDNFTRLGYSIQGAFTQFIATIAPAVAGVIGNIANGIAFIVANLDMLLPAVTVVGAALAAYFGPAAVVAVWGLAVALGQGIVGAIRAIGVAIAANPFGFLLTAIVTIITAVWTFRDAIRDAIGLDVGKIVADAANTVIRSFLTAFERVKFIWNNFPSVMSSAVIGAVNFVIDGLNSMIGASISGINKLISAVPPWLRGGEGGGLIDPNFGQIGKMAGGKGGGTFADQAKLGARINQINKTDYASQLAAGLGLLSTESDTSTLAISELNTSVAGLGEGLGESTKQTEAQKAALKALKEQAKEMQDRIEGIKDTLKDLAGSFVKTFVADLRAGKSAVGALTNAFSKLADKLMDMVIDQAINALIGSLVGAAFGGGSAPGFVSGNGASFDSIWAGFARGGAFAGNNSLHAHANSVVSRPTKFAAGGAFSGGLMGEAGHEAIMPLKRGPGGMLGVRAFQAANSNGNSAPAIVAVSVEINNNASNDVNATAEVGNDGKIRIMIDKITAENINTQGSQTNKAIKANFGLRGATTQR